MNIVNIIHVGNEVYRMDELPEEKQREIWRLLNKQALEAIGYKMNEVSVKEEINDRTKKDNNLWGLYTVSGLQKETDEGIWRYSYAECVTLL